MPPLIYWGKDALMVFLIHFFPLIICPIFSWAYVWKNPTTPIITFSFHTSLGKVFYSLTDCWNCLLALFDSTLFLFTFPSSDGCCYPSIFTSLILLITISVLFQINSTWSRLLFYTCGTSVSLTILFFLNCQHYNTIRHRDETCMQSWEGRHIPDLNYGIVSPILPIFFSFQNDYCHCICVLIAVHF